MEKNATKNFVVRTLSGLILLGVFLGATLLSPFSFALLMMLICVGSMWEFYALAARDGVQPLKTVGIVMGAAMILGTTVMLYGSAFGPMIVAYFILCCVFLLFFAVIAAEIYRNRENPFANAGVTLLGVIYIAVPLTLLTIVPGPGFTSTDSLTQSIHYAPWTVLWYVFIIWMNDIGAYLVGVWLGRHRLFERISPKKSWEGFFGGLLFGVGTGIVAALIMDWNVWFWAGLAAVAVATGVFGDLVESMFKRSAGVKDSGNIIPGHGGLLDRFDALIFSAPFVFLYFLIFAP